MATSIATPKESFKRRGLLTLLSLGFVLTGFPTVIIGPVLPVFISRWGLSDSQAGLFFTVQFAAALAGVWVTTGLTSWRGYRPGIVIGYALTGVGLALVNAPAHWLAILATAVFGLGYGMVVPPTNLSGAEVGGAKMVSFLNFAWGIGAVACSPVVMVALRHHALSPFLWALTICSLALAVLFLLADFPANPHGAAKVETIGGHAMPTPTLGVTVVVATLSLTYVGTETSIGGWAAEEMKRLTGHATSFTTMAPLFFYSGLMVGRGLAPLALARVGELRLVLGALALNVVGVSLILSAKTPATAVWGLTLSGLGCASIYPIYISWFSVWYGAAARKLGGVVFSAASLGGSAVPWVVGEVSTRAGSLRVGLVVPLAGCFVMLGLLGHLRRRGVRFAV